jgi:hypothetical protein
MEWTSNKLANALKNWSGNRDQLWAAANMLQDQAQEIAVFKGQESNYLEMIDDRDIQIAKLKEALEDCTCQGGHSEAYLKAKGKL